VEGTGSHGAALACCLRRPHVTAVEVNRPDRPPASTGRATPSMPPPTPCCPPRPTAPPRLATRPWRCCACANLPAVCPTGAATATVYTLRHLSQRIENLTIEQRQLQLQITTVLNTHAPKLLQRHRAGPDSTAALLTTVGDNPDRTHGEASFAALCWVSPIEALSGRIADAGPTAATTAAPAPLSTASPSAAHAVTTAPAPSSTAAPPKVSPDGKPSAV